MANRMDRNYRPRDWPTVGSVHPYIEVSRARRRRQRRRAPGTVKDHDPKMRTAHRRGGIIKV